MVDGFLAIHVIYKAFDFEFIRFYFKYMIYFRVKGVNNLRVVDVFVLRDVSSGITNATTILIAEKAEYLIRGLDSEKDIR